MNCKKFIIPTVYILLTIAILFFLAYTIYHLISNLSGAETEKEALLVIKSNLKWFTVVFGLLIVFKGFRYMFVKKNK